MDNTIDETFKKKYGEIIHNIKILPGQKGSYKYRTIIENNKNQYNITSNGKIITNNYFICVELEFEKKCKVNEVKLPIFLGINKKNIKPMEFEIKNEPNEKEIHNDSDVYGFENINYLNNWNIQLII